MHKSKCMLRWQSFPGHALPIDVTFLRAQIVQVLTVTVYAQLHRNCNLNTLQATALENCLYGESCSGIALQEQPINILKHSRRSRWR